MISINLKKIKVADQFPQMSLTTYSVTHGIKLIDSIELFQNSEAILFSNPGLFVASYMASQVPTYESSIDKFKNMGISQIYCLVNNDPYVVANYADRYHIQNIHFICDTDYSVSNSLGYLSDFSDQNLGIRCWPISLHLKGRTVHKIFYEDFSVAPIDCYSATSSINILKYLESLKI